MREIQLTRGMTAKVDDADFEELMKYEWHASYHGRNGVDKWYACRYGGVTKRGRAKAKIRMHRQIMEVEDKRVVHHKDDDSLNNQRENLEIVKNNAANMAKCRNWKKY